MYSWTDVSLTLLGGLKHASQLNVNGISDNPITAVTWESLRPRFEKVMTGLIVPLHAYNTQQPPANILGLPCCHLTVTG